MSSGKGDFTHVNSWKMYQTWVKLEEAIRETWIVAGRTIQSFAKVSKTIPSIASFFFYILYLFFFQMGQGNLQEMPVKITKTVVDTSSEVEKSKSYKNITFNLRHKLPQLNLFWTIIRWFSYHYSNENFTNLFAFFMQIAIFGWTTV